MELLLYYFTYHNSISDIDTTFEVHVKAYYAIQTFGGDSRKFLEFYVPLPTPF